MISITCTSCKRVLSIDDAFAGGVCRCQFCGTIQTVPARTAAQKAASTFAKTSKTLFENKARAAGVISGSGLEDLADVVQSSGLSNADLRMSKSPPPTPQKNLTPILGVAAAVIVVLLIVVLMLVFRGSSPKPVSDTADQTSVVNQSSPNAQPSSAAPAFCGIPIDQSVVVYVIDNGASSADVLDAVKSALFKSIDSLGPDRQFQVIFWNTDSPSYPSKGITFAVNDNIDVARKKLTDVTAAGLTDPIAAMTAALADDPGEIFLVTAKAGDLDDSLVDKVVGLRGNSKAKINCIAVNGVPGDKVLSRIAVQTGGQFLPLPESSLKAFAF